VSVQVLEPVFSKAPKPILRAGTDRRHGEARIGGAAQPQRAVLPLTATTLPLIVGPTAAPVRWCAGERDGVGLRATDAAAAAGDRAAVDDREAGAGDAMPPALATPAARRVGRRCRRRWCRCW
jgi:hypothetical protein